MHNGILLYPAGGTPAMRFAERFLKKSGVPFVDHPTPDVTHVLLDVPSFLTDGTLRSGGSVSSLLESLPAGITVLGGNLNHPDLSGYPCYDLLTDPVYQAMNARITAQCAMQIAAEKLPRTFLNLPVLILGWGRIGKFLGVFLRSMGAVVTIAARKPSDRSLIQALGFQAIEISNLSSSLASCRLLFNTVPAHILSEDDLKICRDCLKIDLASGNYLPQEDVLPAKGLPGIYAPESSGELIADTVLRMLKGV